MVRTTTFALAMLLFLVVAPSLGATITGFGNGVGWTGTNGIDNSGGGPPNFTTTTVTLTDGGLFESRSAFYNTPQSVGGFTTVFTYQATEPGGVGLADGVTFMLQNQGVNATGTGNGVTLGMLGISPSAEVEFNVYAGYTIGIAFETNGANSTHYMSTGPVNLASEDPIQVSLNYNGSVLNETLTDMTTLATFSTSYTTNLTSVLGGGTAFVGFTGATGLGASLQTISNFSFTGTSAVPEPSTLVMGGMASVCGITAGLVRKRRAQRKALTGA